MSSRSAVKGRRDPKSLLKTTATLLPSIHCLPKAVPIMASITKPISQMQNPSVYLYGPGDARIEEAPIPTIESPTDAIVEVKFVGSCGSDIHFWVEGGINGANVSAAKPLIMGHEGSGVIHQVGSSVTHLKPGNKVAIEGSNPCRMCQRCKEGHYGLCPKMKFSACPPDTPGMLTRYYKAPADMCHKLPDSASLEDGALVEQLAVGVHAVRTVYIKPGQSLVIFGAGTIGQASGAVARYYGAKKIVAVDIADHKLAFARKFLDCRTYKYVLNESSEENAARINAENDLHLGPDAVIEASGAESSVNCAVHLLRKGGQYVQTGLGKQSINFPILAMSEKELHMHGACRYGPDDFNIALEVLASGVAPIGDLRTTIFDFEQITEAWESTKSGLGIKNMVRCPWQFSSIHKSLL
jgi:D-xylulose reductase